jgi:hypothetical protein
VLCVSWIRQWFSILRSQADTSRAAELSHSKGALPAGGELVSTLLSEHPSEHQIVHLELSATHEPLLVARGSDKRKRFKISLEVATLDVATPFTVVLDGDATILPLRQRMNSLWRSAIAMLRAHTQMATCA